MKSRIVASIAALTALIPHSFPGIAFPIRYSSQPLTHAPLADEGGDVVVAESGANAEGHRVYGLVEVILRPGGQSLHPMHTTASRTRTFAF